MNVTEVTITRQPDQEEHDQRLLGYANITLDGVFAVRDIKIVDGPQGRFVAMPSRKIMDHCPGCGGKNHLRAKFCNDCGRRLADNRAVPAPDGRIKIYCDIAHPVNAPCRELIHTAILDAYVNGNSADPSVRTVRHVARSRRGYAHDRKGT